MEAVVISVYVVPLSDDANISEVASAGILLTNNVDEVAVTLRDIY
jgi:hypothetical protein